MKDPLSAKPAIQVLERSFALFDVLAAHQQPVALKQLSIDRVDLGRLVAHTIVDPFKDARIAAFSLAN